MVQLFTNSNHPWITYGFLCFIKNTNEEQLIHAINYYEKSNSEPKGRLHRTSIIPDFALCSTALDTI